MRRIVQHACKPAPRAGVWRAQCVLAAGSFHRGCTLENGSPMAWHWSALTARHSTGVALLAVAAAFGAAAVGLAAWTATATFMADDGDEAAMPPQPAPAPIRFRCETCGVIEAIRLHEASADAPQSWEFAVRLPDGSLRLSRDPQPGRWKVGDQMQLIGGDRTWNNPQ
jgi:hypothetical protein